MMSLRMRLGVVFVLSSACVGQATTTTTTLPPAAQEEDMIFVYWNLAPLVPGEVGELLTHVGLYHASVSFYNTHTRQSSFVQFISPAFGPALLFPNLSSNFSQECKDPNMWSKSLSWNTPGRVMFVDEAGTGYKWKHKTLVATINGMTYNSVRSWIREAMDVYTEYYLFHAITDQFEEYMGKHAYGGHGGVPIGVAKGPSGMSAEKCQSRCTYDIRCDCATMGSDGRCLKRAFCDHKNFEKDSNYTTWVKIEVETGYKSSTCMDFAHLVLTQLYKLAGPCVFDPRSDGFMTDDAILHVRGKPTRLDPESDPEALDSFCSYYSRMNTIKKGISGGIKQRLFGFAAFLEELVLDKGVLHHGGQYYRFQPVFPFVSYRKRYVPLPGKGECANTKKGLHLGALRDGVALV